MLQKKTNSVLFNNGNDTSMFQKDLVLYLNVATQQWCLLSIVPYVRHHVNSNFAVTLPFSGIKTPQVKFLRKRESVLPSVTNMYVDASR